MDMVTDGAARELIEQTVREHVGSRVKQIEVVPATDLDGDPAFDIYVIYSGRGPLDASQNLEARAVLRERLLERGDHRFPFMWFMTPADWRRRDEPDPDEDWP